MSVLVSAVHRPSQAPLVLPEMREYPIATVSQITTHITVTRRLEQPGSDLRPSSINLIVQREKGVRVMKYQTYNSGNEAKGEYCREKGLGVVGDGISQQTGLLFVCFLMVSTFKG